MPSTVPVLTETTRSSSTGFSPYLAGHDHNLEIRKPINGVTYVVSGAGGKLRDIAESGDPQTLYAASIGNLHLDSPGFPRSV